MKVPSIKKDVLSTNSLALIEEYLHLPTKGVNCPYYNNKRLNKKGLRVMVGKGLPKDIVEETALIALKERIDLDKVSPEEYKRYLVDHKIGVDCSGLAYHILDTETKERKGAPLRSYLRYSSAKNLIRKFLTFIRPIENTSVHVFAQDDNSYPISITEASAGDFITLMSTGQDRSYNHMMVIHKVDHATTNACIHYTHSFKYPSDGMYAHGVRQGVIEILHPTTSSITPLLEQKWSETELLATARQASAVEIRRLSFF